MPYSVYILRSESTGQYYVGHTSDLEDRLRRQDEGRSRGTRHRGPWRLVHREEYATRQAAVVRERGIRKWSFPLDRAVPPQARLAEARLAVEAADRVLIFGTEFLGRLGEGR